MNKLKTLLFLTSLCFISSCNAPVTENITGIEIAGPYSVLVGKTITLIADVIGTENDDVIWSSENESIASVNDYGVVTGVSEGVVNIIATSKANAEIFKSYEISVNIPKATGIDLKVEDNELIKFKGNYTYDVPLGLSFLVDVETVPDSAKQPENINITCKDSNGNELQSNAFDVEILSNEQFRITTYDSMENVIVIVKATYEDINIQALISSLTFNVIDNNKENIDIITSLIESSKVHEDNSLIKSKVNRETKVTTGDSETLTKETIGVDHFINSTYIKNQKVTTSNDASINKNETLYSYSGISNGRYYAFDYDQNKTITKLYKNENVGNNKTKYFETRYDAMVNGHLGILSNIITSSTFTLDGVVGLSNIYCYPYLKCTFGEDSYVITSKYVDLDVNTSYDIELLIYLDDTYGISGYKYSLTSENYIKNIEFKEEVIFETFGTKLEDNNYLDSIDLNDYNFTTFSLVEIAGTSDPEGKYDYSNLDKYGADEVKVIDGITTYVLTYDKALVLKISDFAPSTATTLIDHIEGKSSDTSKIPDVTMVGDGIFTINPKKDDNGHSLTGEAYFTFTSLSGYEVTIKVCFTKAIVKGLLFTSPSVTNNKFNSIFVDRLSDYFFLNSDPDEDIYKYDIKVVEGAEDGIELYKYEDNNIYGNPGFSYSIKGIKPGLYKFKFFIKQATYIETEIYEIEVKEPYSVQYLKEHLISSGNSFKYSTGTMDLILKFVDDTTIQITQEMLGMDNLIQNIKYHFEVGAIVIETKQTYDESFYFTGIHPTEVLFDSELTSISLFMQKDSKTYSKVTFSQMITVDNFESIIAKKPASLEEFIPGYGMSLITLSLENGKGKLAAYYIEEQRYLFEITFDYTYDKVNSCINITNKVNETREFYIVNNQLDVDLNNMVIRVKLFAKYYDDYFMLKIN